MHRACACVWGEGHTQPLKLIAGKPMIYHTYTNANSSPSVRIATSFVVAGLRKGTARWA